MFENNLNFAKFSVPAACGLSFGENAHMMPVHFPLSISGPEL